MVGQAPDATVPGERIAADLCGTRGAVIRVWFRRPRRAGVGCSHNSARAGNLARVGGTPKVYRFASITWIGSAVLGVVSLLLVVWTVDVAFSEPIAFVLAWVAGLAVVGWCWYVLLVQVAYEVRYWPDNGRVVFRSVLHERSTTVTEIQSIRRAFSRRALLVQYDGGSTRLPPFGPMFDFVRDARDVNPAVAVPDV